jgi:uncharacterized membrane protein YgaE (UPF0421/DUF939 family)
MKRFLKEYHKGLKHRADNFSIGMRTVKTALAILVCLLIFAGAKYLGVAGDFDAFLALTAAVICMQDSVKASIRIGLNRLHGIVLGTLLGMGVLYVDLAAHQMIVHVFLVAVGAVVIIAVCNLLGMNQAIVMGCVVFFMITLQTTQGISPWMLGVHRFLDTMAGVVVAIAVNHLIHNPDRADEDVDGGGEG